MLKFLNAISKKIRYFLSAFLSLPRVELSLHYAIPKALSRCRKPFLIINNHKCDFYLPPYIFLKEDTLFKLNLHDFMLLNLDDMFN